MSKKTPTQEKSMPHVVTSPECLAASVLAICQNVDPSQIHEMVDVLSAQSAAIHNGDMSRAESMLIAQAHTLDGLFAKMLSRALTTDQLDTMECHMRLALRAQHQARATLQTLGELKAPKQLAFVRQANIGNQVQVNNTGAERPARTRKTPKAPNELLGVNHEQRMDARAPGTTGRTDPGVAALGTQHRPQKR